MYKVLHVTYGLPRGGVQTWLLQLASQIASDQFEFVLAYHGEASEGIARDLRAAGFRLVRLSTPRKPFSYLRDLSVFLANEAPINVVHSHLNFAGLIMLAARNAGIPVRIAHSHVSQGMQTPGLIARSYVRITNKLFLKLRTAGLAISPLAASALFGKQWERQADIRLMPCGIDLEPFQNDIYRDLKSSLPIPGDRKVIMMVGRLAPEKNHSLALACMVRLVQEENPPCLVIVGAGRERDAIDRKVRHLGLESHVFLLGERSDVPALLKEAANILFLPSITEGCPRPLAVLEACAAGLPCVVSDGLPEATMANDSRIHCVGLGDDIESWVRALRAALQQPRQLDGWKRLQSGPCDIRGNASRLEALYRNQASAVTLPDSH